MKSDRRAEYAEDLAREKWERDHPKWGECRQCGCRVHKDDLVRGVCVECRGEDVET